MTLTLPSELQKPLQERAAQRQMSPEQLAAEALRWYLQIDDEFRDELDAWQEVRDEAWDLIDKIE